MAIKVTGRTAKVQEAESTMNNPKSARINVILVSFINV